MVEDEHEDDDDGLRISPLAPDTSAEHEPPPLGCKNCDLSDLHRRLATDRRRIYSKSYGRPADTF
jgi:hypothetical protein